jgi:hypothetical protein
MKRLILTLTAAGALALCALPVLSLAEQHGGLFTPRHGLLQEDDGAAEWLKAHAPGEPHKMLTGYAGKWDTVITLIFQPGAEPVIVKSEAEIKSGFGGRFWNESYNMKEGPIPHEGSIYIGYDNMKKKYQFVQITSMDTGLKLFEGDFDAKAKKLTLECKYVMEYGGMEIKTRQRNIYHFESADKFTMTVMTHYEGFPDMPEEGVKEVEIVYTRKK